MTRRIRRNIVPLLAVAVVWASATGCAVYRPQSFWEVSQTYAQFESNNFRTLLVGATASATANYLFPTEFRGNMGGIALSDTAILEKAMADLHAQIDDQIKGKSVFLHNILVEWTMDRYFLIYGEQMVTITADAVEFTSEYVDYRSRP